jgi:glycosyl hydrolase family 99
MNFYQPYFFTCVLLMSGVPSACNHANQHNLTLKDLPDQSGNPKILADYQPWFGDPDHINVGYSSQDPNVLRKQIENARSMGIYAFVVDWYGARRPFLDRSAALLQRIAGEQHFHVALMYDETQDDNGHATDDAMEAMDLAYRKYIGPGAPDRHAYLQYRGRPVIFVFPKHGNTDWDQVRQQVNQWESPPILLYQDDPPQQFAKAFDGEYAWVFPGGKGWAPNGDAWGEDYLRDFYKKMVSRSDQVTVGGLWPGFNDAKASWSLNRHIDPRCGKTFEDTLRVFHENNSSSHPIPFVLIATWNDYEEGTAIERGLPRCVDSKSDPIHAGP